MLRGGYTSSLVVTLGLCLAAVPIAAQDVEEEPTAAAPAATGPAAEEAPPAEAPADTTATPPASEPATAPASATVPALAGVDFFGELLFLKPTLDDSFFAIRASEPSVSPDPPHGRRINDDFDYEPAFRIGARRSFGDAGRSWELSYTRLEAEATRTVSGDFLWATRGSPDFTFVFGGNPPGGYQGSASADIDADYQRIDAHVTQPWQLAGIDLGLQFGFEWADYRVGERDTYVDTGAGRTGSVSAASRTWGIGPEVGLALAYEIPEPLDVPGTFRLQAGSSLGLLLSETNTRTSGEILGASVFGLSDDESSRVLTAIHARVGLGYLIPVSERIAAALGVGYQIDTHLNGLSRIQFVDDVGRGLATTQHDDFDLQGVYLSLGVAF
jgi:hypothetical protein